MTRSTIKRKVEQLEERVKSRQAIEIEVIDSKTEELIIEKKSNKRANKVRIIFRI